jgi:hypothetical protein
MEKVETFEVRIRPIPGDALFITVAAVAAVGTRRDEQGALAAVEDRYGR